MSRVTLQAITVNFTTLLSGDAAISIQVPDSFNGINDASNGRFLSHFEVWSDGGTMGDRLHNIRIEDTDLILQGAGIPTGGFPNYPVIYYLEDTSVTETTNFKRGLSIFPDTPVVINKLDSREPFDFIPSGFYIKGTFTTANGLLIGQKIRINVFWGKLI